MQASKQRNKSKDKGDTSKTRMASSQWQNQLSFTERFMAITRLTTAFQTASPVSSDAAALARELETSVLNEADSLNQYHTRLTEVVDELSRRSGEARQGEEQETAESVAKRFLAREGGVVTIGRYRAQSDFAAGLFSVVSVAPAPDLEIEGSVGSSRKHCGFVALKATALARMKPPHDAQREARILKRAASGHVVTLIEEFYDNRGHFVLVMPFLPFTLEQLLIRERKYATEVKKYTAPAVTRRAVRDMFSALAYIHSLDIIHRDIKPSNLLLASPAGPAYLADFGISWCATDGASEPQDRKISDVGTTCYRAPEVLFGDQAYSSSFDMWAAGCIVAEVLLGGTRTLFEGGAVGSELMLVMSIFQTLGTPDAEKWPEIARMPDWGKIPFKKFEGMPWEEILPAIESVGRDLVAKLVRYSGSERLTAEEVSVSRYLGCQDITDNMGIRL